MRQTQYQIPAAIALSLLVCTGAVRAESKHIFGIHFFGWGAAVDVMSHRTGWCVEANATHGGASPDVGGRYKPATAQGFTLLQRLDWKWEQTIPLEPANHDAFAAECASWASKIKNYCRTYSIGNEVEFFDVTPSIYAQCFEKVRNAIKAVQPEANVIIGHMNNTGNQRSVMQILGPSGYDGVTAHVGSHVPTTLLDMLDQENAMPHAGVYITEWGWVADTNPNAMSVMRSFYEALGQSNASRDRQVYCACWFVYPSGIGWDTFSLKLAQQYDNAAFEAATALGTSFNRYADNPITITNLYADIPDQGGSINISWNTDVPATRQLWWTPAGTSGAGNEHITDLTASFNTSHQYTISGLSPQSSIEVMPNSTRINYGDAGGRRYLVKSGPWLNSVNQTGAGKVEIAWQTDWPATARVDYGTTPSLGQTLADATLRTNHQLTLTNLPSGTLYYRMYSGETNSDGDAILLMRAPLRSFQVSPQCLGDIDNDGDVDLDDYGLLQSCFSGAGVPQTDPDCVFARLDGDDDVDAADLALFLGAMTGPDIPCQPN